MTSLYSSRCGPVSSNTTARATTTAATAATTVSFSVTAPRFTDREERTERDGLSPRERADAINDLYGTDAAAAVSFQETAEMRRAGGRYVSEGLRTLAPRDGACYDAAARSCPILVATETEPIRFLRAFRYDRREAASHIARYWAFKMQLFGPERFGLPLTSLRSSSDGGGGDGGDDDGASAGATTTATGGNDGALGGGHRRRRSSSALSREALELLERGLVVRLPNDRCGRVVMYHDRRRFGASTQFRNAVLEVIMYMTWAVVDEMDDEEQKLGIVIVSNAQGFPVNKFDRKLSLKVIDLLQNSLPCRIRAYHCCIGNTIKPPFNLILPVVKHILGRENRQRFVVHSGTDTKRVLSGLERYNLSRQDLPKGLFEGCQLDVQQYFRDWLSRRRTLEREREEAGFYD